MKYYVYKMLIIISNCEKERKKNFVLFIYVIQLSEHWIYFNLLDSICDRREISCGFFERGVKRSRDHCTHIKANRMIRHEGVCIIGKKMKMFSINNCRHFHVLIDKKYKLEGQIYLLLTHLNDQEKYHWYLSRDFHRLNVVLFVDRTNHMYVTIVMVENDISPNDVRMVLNVLDYLLAMFSLVWLSQSMMMSQVWLNDDFHS